MATDINGGSIEKVGDELVIKVNLKNKGKASASGKSEVIASTGGFIYVDGFGVGLNVIKSKK